jgi:hypothetical protein
VGEERFVPEAAATAVPRHNAGMATVGCLDGSVLGVHPVPVLDRDGVPYELTLRLTRDGEPFAEVGERCGYFLAATAARLAAARAEDPDRFPLSSLDGGIAAWAADTGATAAEVAALVRYLPRDRDLFSFRSRDPDDLTAGGELRCAIHQRRKWDGRWLLTRRAVLEAWGENGRGVRAVLTAGELAAFLDLLLAEAAAAGCRYDLEEAGLALGRPAG